MDSIDQTINSIVYGKGRDIYNDWIKSPKSPKSPQNNLTSKELLDKQNLRISLSIDRINAKIKNRS